MSEGNTLRELEEVTEKFAEAESNRLYLMEFRKSKKAILMNEAERANPKMPIAAQERYAYSHEEYLGFEQWRSKQATLRQEMQIR